MSLHLIANPRPNPTVGQIVFAMAIDHRLKVAPHLRRLTVTKVGRTYFYAKDVSEYTFRLDTWRQECGGYSPNLELYESEQAYLDEMEVERLRRSLQRYLEQNQRPPLVALRVAAGVLLPPAP